jgi:hypothetical protein
MPIVFFLARFALRRASAVLIRSFFFIGLSSFAVIRPDEEHERHEQKRFHDVFLEARYRFGTIIIKKHRTGQTPKTADEKNESYRQF